MKSHPLPQHTSCSESGPPKHTETSSGPALIKKILVAVDFSGRSTQVIEYAALFARAFNAKLTLLHVVEPAVYPNEYSMNPSTLDEANQGVLTSSQERLSAWKQQSPLHGLAVEVLVRMGRAHSEIPDTAKAIDSNLIIMGSHRHSELTRALGTGTAERVARNACCPVLLVGGPSR
jgi:nucleotide-binding universal stress UspA family protein